MNTLHRDAQAGKMRRRIATDASRFHSGSNLPDLRKMLPPALALLPGLLIASSALAQTGGGATARNSGYDLTWWTVNGGGAWVTGGGYTLTGASGQPDASHVSLTGGAYHLTGGFWSGGGAVAPTPADTLTPTPTATTTGMPTTTATRTATRQLTPTATGPITVTPTATRPLGFQVFLPMILRDQRT